MKNDKGLTLVETVISIFLLSVLLLSVVGSFYVSRLTAQHARHRLSAMNLVRQFIEYEVRFKYYEEDDGFANPAIVSGDPMAIAMDDGTAATITPEPYYPYNMEDASGELLYYPEDGYQYKVTGFVVKWNERLFGTGQTIPCEERAAVYIARHPTLEPE